MLSPFQLVYNRKENLKNLRTFGCRIYVRPPGIQPRRFKDKVRTGVFLGYLPHTIRTIIYYDLESKRVKIPTHCVFDEGFNDVPVESLPPNVKHLIRVNDGTRVDMKSKEMSCKDFAFHVYPFLDLQDVTIKVQANSKSEDLASMFARMKFINVYIYVNLKRIHLLLSPSHRNNEKIYEVCLLLTSMVTLFSAMTIQLTN